MSEMRTTFLRPSVRPLGLLSAVGVVACSATLLGFLGKYSWILDLFSHFRVQYLLGLTVLAFLFLLFRRRKTAMAFIAFACINLYLVLPLYLGVKPGTPEGKSVLRAMLVNVNTRTGDADRVRQLVQEVAPDILVLEEISARWVLDLAWLTKSYPYSRVQPREDNFGIGLYSKIPFIEREVVYIGDAEVPSVTAIVDTGCGQLQVVATHPVPPASAEYSRLRDDQLRKLPAYIHSSLPTILLGDLNVTPWSRPFRKLLRSTGLIDSSRGRGFQPTWPSYSFLLRIPIDHCLYSSGISVVSRTIGPNVGSDHYPVIIDFTVNSE